MRHAYTCGLLLWAAAGVAVAQGPSPELREIAGKIEEMKRQTRDPLREQIEKRREALKNEADLKNLLLVVENAQKAYDALVATDAEIAAAKKAAEAAAQALPETINARMAADPNMRTMIEEMAAARGRDSGADKEKEDLRRQLEKAREQLRSSPIILQYREVYQQAEKAYYELPQTHPTFLAARKAIEAAQKALQARIETLPEKKALDAANRAYGELRQNSPEIAQSRQVREDARVAYEKALDQMVKADPNAIAVQARLDEIDIQEELAQAQQRSLQEELAAAREELQKSDPEVVKARKAQEEAQAKFQDVMRERAGAEAKALADAKVLFDKQLSEKMTIDPLLLNLQDRLQKAEKEIADLFEKQRELYRQQQEGRRGEGRGEGRGPGGRERRGG
ncbi:MAG TPA: hypothetical protein VM695_06360 [Phycisphaerae bacterium]|nr:hypothetical protein [Phycisphaerae bacterium]